MSSIKSSTLFTFSKGIFILIVVFGIVQCEVFTSQSDLESLIYLRREVNRAIDVYLKKEEGRLEYLKQRLKSSKGLSRGSSGDDDSGNPINAFLLVKALTLDLAEVIAVAGDRENFKGNFRIQAFMLTGRTAKKYLFLYETGFGKRIEDLHSTTAFPDTEDISGAALGLIRLQETYQLDTKSLAKGAIGDSCCAPELSVEDCFELGRQSYNAKNYDYAIQWLTEALLRLPAGELNQVPPDEIRNSSILFSNETVSHPTSQKPRRVATLPPSRVSKEEILSYLHWAEDIKKTLDLGKDFLSQLTGFQLDAFVEQVAQAVAGQQDDGLSQKELGDRYKALCRGDHPGGLSSSINPNLKCYYSTRGNNPYYLVGPIKEELINLDPPMWSFKQVIHPGEIERLKELAKPRVK